MTDDEVTRFLVLLADFQSIREDGLIWIELAAVELSAAASKLAAVTDDLYEEMDECFWEIAGHYDDGWDILRESGMRKP